jgi:hypothetical protein
MVAIHPARAETVSVPVSPLLQRHRGWRLPAVGVSVVSGVVLGISVADIGAAILRSALLVAVLASLVVLTARRLRAR